MPRPKVSCIVVAFHRLASLKRVLDGIDHPDVEVIVANVGDDPEVRALGGGMTRVIAVEGNPGYAAAVNRAAVEVCADTVVFMNDDVIVDAATLLALADEVRGGRTDVAVPRLLTTTAATELSIAALPTVGALVREWLALPDRPVRWLRRWHRVQKWRLPMTPERIDAAAATVVAMSLSLLRAEPLPEEYFLYWEEMEWFWHLRQRGHVTTYYPGLTATHAGGRDDVRADKSRLLARNAVRCVRRTQGRGVAAVAVPVVVAWQLRLVVTTLLRGRFGITPARLAGLAAALGSWRELVRR